MSKPDHRIALADRHCEPMSYGDIHILVVEDNPGDTRLIREMLKETDYASAQLHSFRTLRDALAAPLVHSSVATILLDLDLPDSEGLATLLGIRNTYPDSAIIVLAGLEGEGMAVRALRAGAQNYLTKMEVDPSTLGRTLRNSIERHGFLKRLRENDRLNAERDLRFRMLVHHSADLTLVMDREGCISYASPAVRRAFGYRKDQRMSIFGLIHPEDIERTRADFKRILARPGMPVTMVLRARACDDRYLHLEGTVNALVDVPGVMGVVANFRDVTDRIVLEQRIASDSSNLNALINSTKDQVWSLDRNNCLITGNKAFLDAVEQFSGRRLKPGDSMVFPDMDGAPSADKWFSYFQRALSGKFVRVDERITYPVEAWMEIRYSPIEEDGEIIGVAGFIRDITERVTLEKQIAFERNNLAALINSTPDLVWSVDKDLRLINANEAFVSIIEQAAGVHLVPGDSVMLPDVDGASPTEHWRALYQRALAGESFTLEEHMEQPVEVYNQIKYSPIHGDDGIIGVAVFSRDVTEQRLAQRELERSYREVQTSELQKSSILDALPANIALLDKDGTIVAVNARWRTFAEANGFKGEGHGVGSNYPDIARQATGIDTGIGKSAAEGILRCSRGQMAEFNVEYPCNSPTEPRWFRMQVSPLAAQGDGGTVVMHMDITARKAAEERIIRNEATMAQAQAIAHFGSWELNLDDLESTKGPGAHPHAWSDEFYRILGLEPGSASVTLRNFFDFVHPADVPSVKNALETTLRTGSVYSIDHRIVRPDGTVRWVHEEGAVIEGPGPLRRLVGTTLDISERKSIEERVLQLNSELEQRVADRTSELLLANEQLETEAYTKEKLANELQLQKEEQTASLRYARGIQEALLPKATAFTFFQDHAIMNQPLDLVGGDMYWAHATERLQYVAVGDCTGHGVPGAMLTMVGHEILNTLVLEEEQVRPDMMLARIDRRFQQLFHTCDGAASMKDGMDMALCIIDRETLELSFAGATLSAIVLRDGALKGLAGAKVNLGGLNVPGRKQFTVSTMQLLKGDRLILGTDGFADQFGGPHDRKLMRAGYHELLLSCAHLNASDAVAHLRQRFNAWMGDNDQVDDVLLMVLDV